MQLYFQIIIIGIVILFTSHTVVAAPNHPPGRIVFLGKTADRQRSVWLSLTTAGSFAVEARHQIVDEWTQSQRGLHVTLSPVVSNGSGDPHSLFQAINGELVFIDKDNQQGGIIFPPLPGGLPPGEPTQPIVLPGEPSHPILLPPDVTSPPGVSSSNQTSLSPAQPNLSSTGNTKSGDPNTSTVPLSSGRQFQKQPCVNVWVDGRYFNVKDHRFELDRNGFAKILTVGADRRINNDLIIGGLFSLSDSKSTCFDKTWQIDAKGFALGPYMGYRFLPNWAIEGGLSYGHLKNKNDIAILNSKYNTQVYSASLIATGLYHFGLIQLRPKPALYYNYFYNASYNMHAVVNEFSFAVPIAANRFSFGFSQFAVEASRDFKLVNERITMVPYVELGINYAFLRPNGGKILTGDLTMQKTTPFSGLVRLGARTFMTETFFIESSASYLSLGQSHLNVWSAKLFLSWAFN